VANDRTMQQLSAAVNGETLIREATRYLAVVDVFRAQRCEPTWLPEPSSRGTVRGRRRAQTSGGRRSRAGRR